MIIQIKLDKRIFSTLFLDNIIETIKEKSCVFIIAEPAPGILRAITPGWLLIENQYYAIC